MDSFGARYWAIDLNAAVGLLAGFNAGLLKDTKRADMRFVDAGGDSVGQGVSAKGRVAVISMMGTMTRYGDLCALGTEDYIAQIEQANADSSVNSIVIRADSPGGTVNGVEQLAQAVRKSQKPVVGWIASRSASANYWPVSQSSEVWAESGKTSEVGSVGVYCIREDWTEMLAKQGKKVTIIRAKGCEEKILLNPFEPAPEGAFEEAEASCTAVYDLFKADVIAARPNVNQDALKGKVYMGSEAMKLGLIDKIGSLRDAIKRADQLARKQQKA